MDEQVRNAARRMIPDGLGVPAGADGRGRIAAATLNRVAQVSFKSTVIVGVKVDRGAHEFIAHARAVARKVPGKARQGQALAFLTRGELAGPTRGGAPSVHDVGDKVCHGG